jgi:copper oxidase (laccase) domain-containing protein
MQSNDELRKLKEYGWDFFVTDPTHGNMSLGYSLGTQEKEKKINKFFELAEISSRPVIKLAPSGLNGLVEVDKNLEPIFQKQSQVEDNLYDVYADILITNLSNYAFFLSPGDCATLFFVSKSTDWIGFVHVGFANIIFETIKFALKNLNEKTTGWDVFVFRHIHKESYLHTNSFMYDNLKTTKFSKFIEKLEEEKYLLDLDGAIIEQLKEDSVNNIFVDPADNFQLALQEKSFSHRAYKLGKQKNDYRFLVGIYKNS